MKQKRIVKIERETKETNIKLIKIPVKGIQVIINFNPANVSSDWT